MTEKEIQKGNKLIAEFMGWEFHSKNGFEYYVNNKDRKIPCWGEYSSKIPIEDFDYHLSWDWLMPVVDKIEATFNSIYTDIRKGLPIKKGKYYTYIEVDGENYTHAYYGKTKLEATYKAVIEFIKWYNKNY